MTPHSRPIRAAWCFAAFLCAHTAHAAEPGPPDSAAVPPAATVEPAQPSLPIGRAHGWQSGALRPDRLQHASLAFSLGCGAGLVSRRAEIGFGVSLALGLAKELLDDHVDAGDLAADAAGAALAALVVASLTRGPER